VLNIEGQVALARKRVRELLYLLHKWN
jgi:hypothetical protein